MSALLPRRSEELSHAYILEGDVDSAFALALAQKILCDFGGLSQERWKATGDFLIYDQNPPSMEDIRGLLETLLLHPMDGPYKVYYLPHAGALRVDVQNVLLKSLEEPPSYVVWLLGVAQKSQMLPTIQSRCRTLSLRHHENCVEIDDAVRTMVQAAFRGDGYTIFSQRDFYTNYKENKKEVLLQIRAVLEEMLRTSNFAGGEGRLEGLFSQWERGMQEVERQLQALSQNLNLVLSLEHLFCQMMPALKEV